MHFMQFLDKVASIRGKGDKNASVLNQLGYVYRVIMNFFDSEASGFVQEEIRNWGENWLKSKERTLSTKEVENLALEGVANQLGIGINATRKMAKKGVIEVRKRENQRFMHDVIVATEKTKQNVETMKSDMIGTIHARNILGLSYTTFEKLCDQNFITKNEYALIDGRRNYSFSRNECEHIIQRFRKVAKPIKNNESIKKRKLLMVCGQYSSSELPISCIFKAILNGQIRLFENGEGKGLQCFSVSKHDIHLMVIEIARNGDHDLIDFSTAIQKYGIPRNILLDLSKRTVIRSVICRIGCRKHRLVSESELDAWLTNNIMSTPLAKSIGLFPGRIKDFLAKRGITPSLERHSRSESLWYSRKDVVNLVGIS
ncbi:MAG: hypothetical protein ABW088_02135 [Sedimenticola sp.]